MNLLLWVFTLTLLVGLVYRATLFHRSTVCRQEATRKSFELRTRALLTNTPIAARESHSSCKIVIQRLQDQIWWKRTTSSRLHFFGLSLRGKL